MTADEFSAEIDKAVQPAIERLVHLAFQVAPAWHVEMLVGTYLDMMKTVAIEAVREIIADAGKLGSVN